MDVKRRRNKEFSRFSVCNPKSRIQTSLSCGSIKHNSAHIAVTAIVMICGGGPPLYALGMTCFVCKVQPRYPVPIGSSNFRD